MALVKAKEKEMKDEKEAERKVRPVLLCFALPMSRLTAVLGPHRGPQSEASGKGREGEIR